MQPVLFELKEGGLSIGVEATAFGLESGLKRAAVSDQIVTAAQTFEEALSAIGPAARAVKSALSDLGPTHLEVEFGITLTADSGVIIARAGAEANFKVTMKWEE